MEDIRRVSLKTRIRPTPKRSLVVPARSATHIESVNGKAFLSNNTTIAKQLVKKPLKIPEINLATVPAMPASSSVSWSAGFNLSPVEHNFKLPRDYKLLKQIGLGMTVLAVLSLSIFVSVDAWLTTKHAKQQISNGEVAGVQTSANESAVDETKPPENWVSSYVVAPDLPRRISIPSLSVNARITRQSMAADGTLTAPKSIYDTGWYDGSSKPGQGGAVLIDGHSTGLTTEGVFNKLDNLSVGEVITIERGDGQIFNYKVDRIEIVKADAVNMSSLLMPGIQGTKGLNLISCTGDYDAKTNTYSHRVLVFATQQ